MATLLPACNRADSRAKGAPRGTAERRTWIGPRVGDEEERRRLPVRLPQAEEPAALLRAHFRCSAVWLGDRRKPKVGYSAIFCARYNPLEPKREIAQESRHQGRTVQEPACATWQGWEHATHCCLVH